MFRVGTAFETLEILDEIIERIDSARTAKNYELADSLKAGLANAGVKIMISKEGIERELEPDFDPMKLEALL